MKCGSIHIQKRDDCKIYIICYLIWIKFIKQIIIVHVLILK